MVYIVFFIYLLISCRDNKDRCILSSEHMFENMKCMEVYYVEYLFPQTGCRPFCNVVTILACTFNPIINLIILACTFNTLINQITDFNLAA